MIRVLHILNCFDQGGIENFIMNVYRNIDRSKIQFDFALTENVRGYFEDEIESLGGRCFYFDSNEKNAWNYYFNLRRIIKANGPYSTVHSHLYYFSGFFLLVARLCGVKTRIAHSHETLKGRKPTLIRKCYESLMRWMIKKNATHWLSCSDIAGQYVFGNGVPYQVLYNGIDLNRFKFNEDSRTHIRKKLCYESSFVVMNVGRFAHQKNHYFIIKVFYELLKIIPNAQLLLIGTGSMQKEIAEFCKKLEIFDKVTILSNIQDTEKYYCSADAFILPSIYEGMGIVVIESQTNGLPTLISTNVTKEVGVTDIAKFLPIDNTDAINLWVKELSNIATNQINRSVYWSHLLQTSFNIDVTVRDLTSIYITK